MIRFIFPILSVILLIGCQSNSKKRDDSSDVVDMRILPAGELYYQGHTKDEDMKKLIQLAERQNTLPDTLIIDSGGGDVFGGMHLGRWLHDNQIKVIVKNNCASSCANYIITGAAEVTIQKGALIGWHGGSSQKDWHTPWFYHLWPPLIISLDRELARFRQEEKAFFEHICVSQDITVVGQFTSFKSQRIAPFWTYKPNDFKRFGVYHLNYQGPITTEKNGIKAYIIDLKDFKPNMPSGCITAR